MCQFQQGTGERCTTKCPLFIPHRQIILSTGKTELAHGQAYTQYVISEVKKEAIFSWLDIVPINYWATFLFLDPHNYGGVPFAASGESGELLAKYVEAHNKNIAGQQGPEEGQGLEDKENNHDENEANIKKNKKVNSRRRGKRREINMRFEDDTESEHGGRSSAATQTRPQRGQSVATQFEVRFFFFPPTAHEITRDENEVPVVSHWNIWEYLPLKAQSYFVLMILEFVRILHQNKELHRKLKSRLNKGAYFPSLLLFILALAQSLHRQRGRE